MVSVRACPTCNGEHRVGTRCPVWDARAASMARVRPQVKWGKYGGRRPAVPGHAAYKRQLMREAPYCVDCGAVDGLELDHVVELADGGEKGFENLVLRCKGCHTRKGLRAKQARRKAGLAKSYAGLLGGPANPER